MRERVLKIIESEGITAAEFADAIGVQRSNVSHVLNGRNNPGFSFIQKILEAYPKVNSRWLLTGSGNIYEDSTQKIKQTRTPDLFSTMGESKVENTPQPPKKTDKQEDIKPIETVNQQQIRTEPGQSDKKIARVLIFYNDHTFDDYRPAQ
jgi:transcriptional regulator with XRE-family HTH domain